MTPRNEDNFLIEVTPEVLSELRDLYKFSDEDPIAELHYSPYWKKMNSHEDETQGDKL